MDEDHIGVLSKALEQLIEDRRTYAAKLASQSQPEERERWRPMFVQIQEAIKAVEFAIEDEKRLSGRDANKASERSVDGEFDAIFSLSS